MHFISATSKNILFNSFVSLMVYSFLLGACSYKCGVVLYAPKIIILFVCVYLYWLELIMSQTTSIRQRFWCPRQPIRIRYVYISVMYGIWLFIIYSWHVVRNKLSIMVMFISRFVSIVDANVFSDIRALQLQENAAYRSNMTQKNRIIVHNTYIHRYTYIPRSEYSLYWFETNWMFKFESQ